MIRILGVTGVKFDEVELPATMTDVDHDTWMLSGMENFFSETLHIVVIVLVDCVPI